jgi:hypothetical protein
MLKNFNMKSTLKPHKGSRKINGKKITQWEYNCNIATESEKSKARICPDCETAELEKWQKKCPECRELTRHHCQAIVDHNRVRHPDHYYDYNRTEGRKKYMREYMRKYRERLKNEHTRTN